MASEKVSYKVSSKESCKENSKLYYRCSVMERLMQKKQQTYLASQLTSFLQEQE